MDYDTMFFLSFFFVCFFFPIFVYPYDQTRYWMFLYEYNENLISKGTALSLLGVASYMTGSVFYKSKNISRTNSRGQYTDTTLIGGLSVFGFICYIVTGGYSALINMYKGEGAVSGVGQYFFIIAYVGIFCMIIAWQYNSYIKSGNFKLLSIPPYWIAYIVMFIFLMLYSGSRGKVINIALLSLGVYSCLFRPFSLKKVAVLSVIGIIFMFSIVLYRSNGSENVGQFADVVMDLMINSRNTYAVMEYVDENGFSFGRSMLGYTLAVIPFAQNVIFSLFNIDPDTVSSSLIITKETIGTTSEVGLGTTVIADLYLAFGEIGVICGMAALGLFISYTLENSKKNIYALIAYGIMMCFAVYQPRSEIFFSLRVLIWSLAIMNISRLHPIKIRFGKNEKSLNSV